MYNKNVSCYFLSDNHYNKIAKDVPPPLPKRKLKAGEMPKIVNNFEIDLRKIAGEDLKPEVDQLPETIPPPPPPPKDKVITFFRLIQHQTEFHLVLNQSETFCD